MSECNPNRGRQEVFCCQIGFACFQILSKCWPNATLWIVINAHSEKKGVGKVCTLENACCTKWQIIALKAILKRSCVVACGRCRLRKVAFASICILSFLPSKCHFAWSDLFRFPIRGLSSFSCSDFPKKKRKAKKQINAKQKELRTNVQRTNIFRLQERIRFFQACEHTHKSKTHFYYPSIEQI